MGVAFERRVLTRFAVVTAVSLAVGFGTRWSLRTATRNSEELRRSHSTLEGFQELLLLVRDAESGQRG